MKKRETGFRDRLGKPIKEGSIVRYKRIDFEVVWTGAIFKVMEMTSMFSMKHGDFYLEELTETYRKGSKITNIRVIK